jgi:hypothetical protein
LLTNHRQASATGTSAMGRGGAGGNKTQLLRVHYGLGRLECFETCVFLDLVFRWSLPNIWKWGWGFMLPAPHMAHMWVARMSYVTHLDEYHGHPNVPRC